MYSTKPQGRASPARAAIGRSVAARLDADPAMQRLPSDAVEAWRSPAFFDAATCDRLIAMIEGRRRPSTLMSEKGTSPARTSESCDMDRHAPEIRTLDDRIAAALGLAPENGETLQGQRYAPGQHFRAHHDFFHEGEGYWPRMKAHGGQRTWTAMVYLNEVEEGGATWFPQAGLRAAPRPGMMLVWNNLAADGSPNVATLHEGMPVLEGVKYIVTKWFREEPWTALPA